MGTNRGSDSGFSYRVSRLVSCSGFVGTFGEHKIVRCLHGTLRDTPDRG